MRSTLSELLKLTWQSSRSIADTDFGSLLRVNKKAVLHLHEMNSCFLYFLTLNTSRPVAIAAISVNAIELVSAAKRTSRKNITPATAPGLVTEYTVITNDKTTRTGIMNFETCSIPLRTPA